MEYEESERPETEYGEGEVHVRQEDRGVMFYAVFDGEEQVSEEYGPMGEDRIIGFLNGYRGGKENYEE